MPWNDTLLQQLATWIRNGGAGTPPVSFSQLSAQDREAYADAVELGNQIVTESPYNPYLGSVYIKDGPAPPPVSVGPEKLRRGGQYWDKNRNSPIEGNPNEDDLKFRTPKAGEKGKVIDCELFCGPGLTEGKWNPWQYEQEWIDDPGKPSAAYNVLKSLEYGYKNLPYQDHSPHIVVLFTGHESLIGMHLCPDEESGSVAGGSE